MVSGIRISTRTETMWNRNILTMRPKRANGRHNGFTMKARRELSGLLHFRPQMGGREPGIAPSPYNSCLLIDGCGTLGGDAQPIT